MHKISVVGLGKLGAPMYATFAKKGFEVIGLDLNRDFVDALNAGRAPVIEPGLQDALDESRARHRATTDYAELVTNSDITFIIVPTPSGADKFFVNDYLINCLKTLGEALRHKAGRHTVVISSTVMPGSTGGVLRETLEVASGRSVGPQLGLCYNPEFIALGSVMRDMLRPDMILIGESDPQAGDELEAIYRATTESDPEFQRMNWVNAELAKIAVNTFVTTKISYANMLAELCDNLPDADCDAVTTAIGADSRIGRKYLKGAIGYAGPCFPRDNKAFVALGERLGVRCDLAKATDVINDHQISRIVGAVEALAPADRRVAVLGLSYKPDTPVIEESQGVALCVELARSEFFVTASDPMALDAAAPVLGDAATLTKDPEAAIAAAAVVVITTPWAQFRDLPPECFEGKMVVDPWRVLGEAAQQSCSRLVKMGRGDANAKASRIAAE